MRVGILALQGAFIEHKYTLDALHIESFEIRQKKDIQTEFDGLIIPGGESTVMGKLLRELKLFDPIKELIAQGLPVFGTCAGLLLLAKDIENDDKLHLATMDIVAKRNAYGRQLGSFTIEENFQGIGKIPMIFIRAPYINSVQDDAEVLATVNGKIVAAKQKNQLVTAFHPELTQDISVHKYFVEMIRRKHS
ncbi:pyridoxal 5'-phosphate synthase glutaminase subunit PdxT [Anaerotignum sp.]|uniref:pyridoxal 5'-phosphate synthase glutaminase subunit PdxT n=1 Tax=Anaerotignum sp. TaxID=2039241 RepID=UPI00271494F2|nr:pyridoxal 5'-phosphate synthase glutaminase subunit PdxT [Anaerotignum sp.]